MAPDHSTKNIEVKTSDGEVMKFEGISRKFTRKLYEWEKARGIGPEASTFALLHPGYCPIDVGRINKECNKGKWREEQRERESKKTRGLPYISS